MLRGWELGVCTPCLLLLLKVSPYSAYLHDALVLYAQTVEEMMKAERDFRDGRQLISTLRAGQVTLQGKAGLELRLLSHIPVDLEMLGTCYNSFPQRPASCCQGIFMILTRFQSSIGHMGLELPECSGFPCPGDEEASDPHSCLHPPGNSLSYTASNNPPALPPKGPAFSTYLNNKEGSVMTQGEKATRPCSPGLWAKSASLASGRQTWDLVPLGHM